MRNQDVFDSREFKRAVKFMGEKNAREFCAKNQKDLDDAIASATVEVQRAVDETKQNSKYQKAVEEKKLFESSLRDATAPKKAVIALATFLRCQDVKPADLKAAK